jgi:general secretion pathway protein G
MRYISSERGFTLIELVMVIIIMGILAGVATMNFVSTLETAKFESTRAEMEALAHAIAGNPELFANGARSDFGYVGDIGSLPPNLDALITDPGYSTWDGPYIKSDFVSDDFKKDAWNVDYVYSDTLLRSTGSGSNIDKIFASNTSMLLSNDLSGYIDDANRTMPGSIYKDSISVTLIYPDGAGNMISATTTPDANGNYAFTGIPVGNHTLHIIYIPDSDTVEYQLSISPARDTQLATTFSADLW